MLDDDIDPTQRKGGAPEESELAAAMDGIDLGASKEEKVQVVTDVRAACSFYVFTVSFCYVSCFMKNWKFPRVYGLSCGLFNVCSDSFCVLLLICSEYV